jgi:hypothetical protein
MIIGYCAAALSATILISAVLLSVAATIPTIDSILSV